MLGINREGSENMLKRVAARAATKISAEEAAGLVKSGMWLDYATSLCQPDVFDKALGARVPELENLKIRNCLTMRPRAVLDADPNAERVHWLSLHFSGYDRKQHDAGRAHYLPVNLGEIPEYYRRFIPPVDIAIFKTAPMDADGFFNFGPSNLWHRAIVERAKLVIVEVNAKNIYVYGAGTGVHVSEVDYIIDGDDAPPVVLPNPAPTDVDRAVAKLIAAEVGDGACLQIGIGGMPNAVCTTLLESGAGDFGIHTEMMTDGIAALIRGGRVSNTRKALNKGKSVYSFALGSAELYALLDHNPGIEAHPVDHTNLPHNIMQNDNVISINSTTQIDLQGQAASESDGNRHITGTGGQLQFVRGAYASKGGKSFICLPSTYDKKGERRSRIVMNLTHGNIVTTPRTDTMYVVTEFGIVNLKGKSVPERAQALISIAHPDFRDGLEVQARELNVIPRGFVA
jgi:acyl-CoA hydrolase